MKTFATLIASLAIATPASAAFSDPTDIDNPYLPLSGFHRCTYAGHEGDARMRIRRTVLDRTKTFVVDGVPVEAMVVKDRVHEDGELVEDTRDFFAQDDRGAVRYLGERVDNIRDGRVVDHDGTWLFGRDTHEIGVLMPAHPGRGHRWQSEAAPPVAVEFDRMVGRLDSVEVHDRRYRRVIDVREFALPDREVEHKLYARGIGVIEELPPDGEVGLVSCDRS